MSAGRSWSGSSGWTGPPARQGSGEHEARGARRQGGARALEERVWPLLESGAVKPIVHATFPIERAADAHRLLEASGHIGKVVLTINPSGRF